MYELALTALNEVNISTSTAHLLTAIVMQSSHT